MRTDDGDPARVVTVLPGRGYGPDAPLLHFARAVFARAGWTVRILQWRNGFDTSVETAMSQAEEAIDSVGAGTHVLVAKSLGTMAMPYAVERSIHGVWLTPLLIDPEVEAASQQLSPLDLLVGGTEDEAWDAEVARSSGAKVLQVEGADHGMELTGPVLDSIDVLRSVTYQIETFREMVDPGA